MAYIFSTNTALKQQNPYPMIEKRTNTPIVAPTEKPIPTAPTKHAATRVPEQPVYPSVYTTPAYPMLIDQDNPSPPRVAPPVLTDNVPLPPVPYSPRPPTRVYLANKINQHIIDELKKVQPFHQHNHNTRLATRHTSRFSSSGVNRPFYHF